MKNERSIVEVVVPGDMICFQPKYDIGQKVWVLQKQPKLATIPAKTHIFHVKATIIEIWYVVSEKTSTLLYKTNWTATTEEENLFFRKKDAERECKRRNK